MAEYEWEKYLEEDRDQPTPGAKTTELPGYGDPMRGDDPTGEVGNIFAGGPGGSTGAGGDLYGDLLGGGKDGPEADPLMRTLPWKPAPGTQGPEFPGSIIGRGAEDPANGQVVDEAAGGIPDVNELRAEPWTTEFEQAALSRADELASEKYNALRQAKQMEMARRGIGPDSPLYQKFMDRIDADQAREGAGFRRNLQIEKVDRRQKNLAAARLIEQQADTMERQRMMDLLQMMSGAPNLLGQQANIQQLIAQITGQRAASAEAGASSAMGGVGDLLAALLESGILGGG